MEARQARARVPADLDGRCIVSVRTVEAFQCDQCDAVYIEALEAAKCCICSGCGEKYDRKAVGSFGPLCNRCAYGQSLRRAREDARRQSSYLASAKKHLAHLLKAGRPKTSAKRGAS